MTTMQIPVLMRIYQKAWYVSSTILSTYPSVTPFLHLVHEDNSGPCPITLMEIKRVDL